MSLLIKFGLTFLQKNGWQAKIVQAVKLAPCPVTAPEIIQIIASLYPEVTAAKTAANVPQYCSKLSKLGILETTKETGHLQRYGWNPSLEA